MPRGMVRGRATQPESGVRPTSGRVRHSRPIAAPEASYEVSAPGATGYGHFRYYVITRQGGYGIILCKNGLDGVPPALVDEVYPTPRAALDDCNAMNIGLGFPA